MTDRIESKGSYKSRLTVSAAPIMSLLVFMVLAIACFWMGVGTLNPRLCSPLTRGAGTPSHTHSSIPVMSSLQETTGSASVAEASAKEVLSVEGVLAVMGTASLATCREECVDLAMMTAGTLPIDYSTIQGGGGGGGGGGPLLLEF